MFFHYLKIKSGYTCSLILFTSTPPRFAISIETARRALRLTVSVVILSRRRDELLSLEPILKYMSTTKTIHTNIIPIGLTLTELPPPQFIVFSFSLFQKYTRSENSCDLKKVKVRMLQP